MKRLALVALALASTAVAPVFAVSTSSATLGPLIVTLYDLDGSDGVSPSITFSIPYADDGSHVHANADDEYAWQSSNQFLFGRTPFEPLSVSTAGVTNAWSTASVSGSGSAQGSILSANGTALGTGAPIAGSYRSSYWAEALAPYLNLDDFGFTLSANTMVLFKVTSSLSATTTVTWDPSTTTQWENAYASAGLELWGPGASGSGEQYTDDYREIEASFHAVTDASCGSGYCHVGESFSETTTLAGSFVNATNGTLDGYLQLYAYVDGESFATAVPEPATCAMLMAGLAAVGLRARRRRA